MGKTIDIGGRIHNPEVGNVVTGANEILDDTKNKKQDVINSEVDSALEALDAGKQDNLTFDQTPTESSTNPVTSGGVYAADLALQQAIEAILVLIPSAASALNQLADKSFVNSSIATASATFRGTYNLVSDLHLSVTASHQDIATALASVVSTADNNDYCFVQIPTSDTSSDIRVTERYKFNGTAWGYEYDLNNSGFTATQWEAINSGITALLVTKLGALPTAAELAASLAGKQNVLTFDNVPVSGSDNPVKSGGLYQLFTAIDAKFPSDASSSNKLVAENRLAAYVTAVIEALDASFDLTSTDGHVTFRMTQTNGVIASVQILTSDIASASQVSTNTADIAALQAAYAGLTQSDIIVVNGALPSSGQQQNVIYRQPDQDNTPPQFYSDYMWNGSTWLLMATYNNAIDAVPTAGSDNLVKSGGVAKILNLLGLTVGGINADGSDNNSPINRARSNYYKANIGEEICLVNSTGCDIYVYEYENDGDQSKIASSGWLGNKTYKSVYGKYMRFVFRYTDDRTITDSDFPSILNNIKRTTISEIEIQASSEKIGNIADITSINDFEQGSYDGSGSPTSTAIRVRTEKKKVQKDDTIFIKVGENQKIVVGFWDSQNNYSYFPIPSTQLLTFHDNGHCAIIVGYQDDSSITPKDVKSVILFGSIITEAENSEILYYDKNDLTSDIYEQYSDGQYYRGYISIKTNTNIFCKIQTNSNILNYLVTVGKGSSYGNNQYYDSGWFGGNKSISLNNIEEGEVFIIIAAAYKDNSGVPTFQEFISGIDSLGIISWKDKRYIGYILEELESKADSTIGNNEYYGNRIVLNNITKEINYCNKNILDTVAWAAVEEGGDPLSVPSNILIHTQALEIFGDYIFNFLDSRGCYIMAKSDYSRVGIFNIDFLADWHYNNVQFTPYYYQPDDEFPMILISYGGNEIVGGPAAKCCLVRIIRNVSVFEFEKVKEIQINTDICRYYGSFAADYDSNKLIMWGNEKYYADSYNVIHILSFELPNLTNNESVVLTDSDILTRRQIKLGSGGSGLQGGTIINGKIIFGTKGNFIDFPQEMRNKYGLIFVNEASMEVENFVPTNSSEIEGVCFHDNKIYMNERSGGTSHQEGDIIYKLNSFDFN